jgi:GT2 family glycosyltransferase
MIQRNLSICVCIPTTHEVDAVSLLAKQILSGTARPDDLVILDNGPIANRDDWSPTLRASVLVDPHILGSAAAFLECLRIARVRGFEFALLIDHDAEVTPDLIQRFKETLARVNGPVVLSANTNGCGDGWAYLGPYRLTKPNAAIRSAITSGSNLVPIDFAPWSGMLIPTMDPDTIQLGSILRLFFSWDDYSFCAMLRRNGVSIIGALEAGIIHPVTGRRASWKAYYEVRNSVLFSRAWIDSPLVRFVTVGLELLRWSLLAGFGTRGRSSRNTMLLAARGLRDGILGRVGSPLLPDASKGS